MNNITNIPPSNTSPYQIQSGKIIPSNIASAMIQSGTINSANITYTNIVNNVLKEYFNEDITFDEYTRYGVSAKNCVIRNVTQWSSYHTMVGKTDKKGNYWC